MDLGAIIGWKRREPTYRNALKALGSAAMGVAAVGVCLYFLAPEYKLHRQLAADGIIADGVVESVVKHVSKRSGKFSSSHVWYDVEVQGPDHKVEFETYQEHETGDEIRYIESPTLYEVRELSPGTTRDQVFGDLTYNWATWTLLALALFGVAHTGRELASAFVAAAGARRASLAT